MKPFLTIHDPRTARAYHEAGLWGQDTFYSLLARNAAARPDDTALRDGRCSLNWGELVAWVDAVAADMRAQGLRVGDRVSVWLPNRVETVVVFLACSREGWACNPSLHYSYTCAEIATLLERLRAAVLVTEPGWGADRATADVDAVLDGVASLRRRYSLEELGALRRGGEPAGEPHPPQDDPDRVGYLAFTSGTTGQPKCVMHSSNTLMANARDMVRDWGLDHATRLYSLSPLSHHIAWVGVSQWLLAGCQFIADAPPQGMSRLDWLLHCGTTYVMGVPTHAMDILQEQRTRGIESLGAVNQFYMAGSPIPPTVADALLRQGARPQNVYGMTENSSHQYTHPTDSAQIITTTCGRGGPAYQIRIFDADDADRMLETGQEGQIGGKGAALMLGYYDNQQATEDSFNADGWFMSGDLGMLDAHGNLHVRGRLKDLIIRGGHNIYPSHIEALALRHPQVEKCAAFPVPDERLGERVCLAIIGAQGGEQGGGQGGEQRSTAPNGPAMLAHLHAEGLSKYDMPEYFLRVEAFPLTPSGKILKRELPEMLKRGEIAPEPVRFVAPETAGPNPDNETASDGEAASD